MRDADAHATTTQDADGALPIGPESAPAPPLKHLDNSDGTDSATEFEPQNSAYGRTMLIVVSFVAGAVFWHLVGFWSLVSNMVFSGVRERTIIISTSHPQNSSSNSAKLQGRPDIPILTRSQVASHRLGRTIPSATDCTTLSQDTPGGPITKVPCPTSPPPSPEFVEDPSLYTIETGSIEPRSQPARQERYNGNSQLLARDVGWSTSTNATPPQNSD